MTNMAAVTHPRSSQLRPPPLTGSRPPSLSRSHSGRSRSDPEGLTENQKRDGSAGRPNTDESTETPTDLKDSVFQVQDVDVVVSCTDDQTVVLKHRTEGPRRHVYRKNLISKSNLHVSMG